MEMVEKSSERERERDREIWELKETLKHRRESCTERNETENPAQMNESPMYREKKNEGAPYREDNEREREYREVVQHQQDTIEMLLKEIGGRDEQVNEVSNRNTEVSGTKNERVETIGEANSYNNETHQLPNENASLEGLKGSPSAGHNLSPETLRRTLQNAMQQAVQQILQQTQGHNRSELTDDQRGQEIPPVFNHETRESNTNENLIPESVPRNEVLKTPDRLRVTGDRLEALNQQLSEERKKTQRERETARTQ